MNAARYFAAQAASIEVASPPGTGRFAPPEYIHFWSSAVVFSVMAAEADVYDLMTHEDRYEDAGAIHLRFEESDHWREVIERYSLVHLSVTGSRLETGRGPAQAFKALVKLRNALVHAKTEWRDDAEHSESVKAACGNRFKPNPYLAGTIYFPDHCMSADSALWATRTTETFVRQFSHAIKARPSL